MKRLALLLVAVLVAAPAGAADVAANKVVLAPAKRLDALKLAAKTLNTRQPDWKTATVDLPDPFYRTNFAPTKTEQEAPVEPVRRETRSDLEILQAAAAEIRPTGTMMVDGENYLLMNGRRHKAGAVLSVTIDGLVHQIAISAIDGKTYTLRLNEQELRQQLK